MDYIFEEDDPLSSWLEEREKPDLDGANDNWLSDDDNEISTRSSYPQPQGSEPTTCGGGNNDNDTSNTDDGNDNSASGAGGETFIPSTYPESPDDFQYFSQVDVGTSTQEPSPPWNPPPPYPSTSHDYYPHSSAEDSYSTFGYSDNSGYSAFGYGDCSGSTINYGYGNDAYSSESSQCNPYPPTTQPAYESFRSNKGSFDYMNSFFNYPPPRNDWFFSGQQHEGQSSQSHTQSQEETQDPSRYSFW